MRFPMFATRSVILAKPPMPKPLAGLAIRPELRYDRSINKTRSFNQSSNRDQFTLGIDFLVT